jgi:hypothetical protein
LRKVSTVTEYSLTCFCRCSFEHKSTMHIINVFIQLSVICIASSIKSHIPTKLFKHTNIINKTINKSIYHVGLMITITSSTVFSTTNLLPPSLSSSSVAYAVGPTQVPLTITSYKAVELCDGRKPIMPGQKAMEGLIMIYMICCR